MKDTLIIAHSEIGAEDRDKVKTMVILHIASIENVMTSGVNVAVPQHIRAQAKYAQVGLLNVLNECIPYIENQFPFEDSFSFSNLPEPFCKPDLIVFHEVYKPSYLKLYRQAKAAGIPYVIVPHGCLTKGAQRKKRLKKIAGNLLLFNYFIGNASAIQFLSETEMSESDFGKKKFIGTNGIPMPECQKLEFENSNVRLIFIGRLDAYHKGLDLMADAIHTVSGVLEAEKCTVDIYGPDKLGNSEKLRTMFETKKLENLVTVHGPVYGKEKENVLRNSDVFIQTSRFEGMPMGILEALAYGLPCIITRGTNLGDIVEQYDAGWVAETDSKSIAETMLKALSERESWEKKSRNAIRLIEENFRWDKVAENTAAEYQRILEM